MRSNWSWTIWFDGVRCLVSVFFNREAHEEHEGMLNATLSAFVVALATLPDQASVALPAFA
jgi:hypothetical protein